MILTYGAAREGLRPSRNDYANVIFALSSDEFDYGQGEGGLETDKN